MTNEMICPVSGESLKEEKLNYCTHLIGLILSVFACGYLLFNVDYSENPIHFVSCTIYAATLVALYAASTYYHGARCLTRKHRLKIADHICIYLLIAGSYTPFTLGPLRERGGWEMFYIVWGVAAVGALFKIFTIERFKIFSVVAYLAMGWLMVLNFPAFLEELSWPSLLWLMAGGAVYSLGVIFYVWDDLLFNHAIWHLFVLGGSACHYFSILHI